MTDLFGVGPCRIFRQRDGVDAASSTETDGNSIKLDTQAPFEAVNYNCCHPNHHLQKETRMITYKIFSEKSSTGTGE